MQVRNSGIIDTDYYKSKVYEETLKKHYVNRAILVSEIARKGEASDLSETMKITQSSTSGIPFKTNLPKFSGKWVNWLPFRDLFKSIIIDTSEVSDVVKMHYLKSTVTGDAARVVQNFSVTGENFAPAWDALYAEYNNNRKIISVHLHALLNAPAMHNNVSVELKLLLCTISDSVNALKALELPVDKWDSIILQIILDRLTPELSEAWECNIGASTTFPTLDQLKTFLKSRIPVLES